MSLKNICLRTLTRHPRYIIASALPQELHEQLYTWFEIKGRTQLDAQQMYVSSEAAFSQLCKEYITAASVREYGISDTGYLYRRVREYDNAPRINFFVLRGEGLRYNIQAVDTSMNCSLLPPDCARNLSATISLFSSEGLMFYKQPREPNLLIVIRNLSAFMATRGLANGTLYGPIYMKFNDTEQYFCVLNAYLLATN